MRIWSLHPRYLDRQGLVACWRETLLAQAVLLGRTKGYTAHPQLARFRAQPDPLLAVGAYLGGVHIEAQARGYRFDASKIHRSGEREPMPVTQGQLRLEWGHLEAKLLVRSPEKAQANLRDLHGTLPAAANPTPALPDAHPMMDSVPGGVEPWERAEPGAPRA